MGSQNESKMVAKCCKVRHQRLCLAVDMADERLLGHSELSVARPAANEPPVIGLNARDLDILRVTVNGIPARFSLRETNVGGVSNKKDGRLACARLLQQCKTSELLEKSLKSNADAADAAFKEYVQSLADDLSPELLVWLPDPLPPMRGRCVSASCVGPSLSGRSSDPTAVGNVGTPESGGSLCVEGALPVAAVGAMTSATPATSKRPVPGDLQQSGSPPGVGREGGSTHEVHGSNDDGLKEDGMVEALASGTEAWNLLENQSKGPVGDLGADASDLGFIDTRAKENSEIFHSLPSNDVDKIQTTLPASDVQGTKVPMEGQATGHVDVREMIGTQAFGGNGADLSGSLMMDVEASAPGSCVPSGSVGKEGMASGCGGDRVHIVGGEIGDFEEGGEEHSGGRSAQVEAVPNQALSVAAAVQREGAAVQREGSAGGQSVQRLNSGAAWKDAVPVGVAGAGPMADPVGSKSTGAGERTNAYEDAGAAAALNIAPMAHGGKSEAPVEEVLQVRVDYKVKKPRAGAFFSGGILHTDNQLHRARCWFPCIDSSSERCSFDLEFTVDSHLCAVSNGELLYQVYDGINEQQKTYVYKLPASTAACNICLVVAPLVILPDRYNTNITHLCMPGHLRELKHTISFINSVYSCYEDYLGTPFPYGCYKQVFLDAEDLISGCQVFASVTKISSHLLIDERVIDKTIDARCKLAHALSQQWFGQFIAPESGSDAWLVEGLAAFLTDIFVRRAFGANELAYWRYKANEAVCQADVKGFPPLSVSTAASEVILSAELLEHRRVRALKAVGILGMLEKQMGSDQFRKVMQKVVRGRDPSRQRTLSLKDFRHIANKTGGLDRPFLKAFFFRWVDCPGCPRIRAAFAYNRRRNLVELAVKREATAPRDPRILLNRELVKQAGIDDAELGWPGMMTVRLYELDGMFDHPRVPMIGDACQLVEIQCHSKLTSRRVTKKKPTRIGGDGDDNGDSRGTGVGLQNNDARQSTESPLLWVRVDPENEWLVELELHQPEHMWINQLEKERDVVGQLQAINGLRSMSSPSFAAVNALSTCLTDPKIYCRVRMEAAYALGDTANEATNWSGLSLLIKFYKDRYYDPDTCTPRPNNFGDFAEYFVNQAVVGAIASVQGNDGTSPTEAVDFLVDLLKYNDNSSNPFIDAHWLAVVIEAIGGLQFGEQNINQLPRVLKQIDRYLQFDRLFPSYQHLVSASCLWALSGLCHKLPKNEEARERLIELLRSYTQPPNRWRARLAAFTSLVDLELQSKGLDPAVAFALRASAEDRSLRVSLKLLVHLLECCKMLQAGGQPITVSFETRSMLLQLMSSERAFKVASFRYRVFLLLQMLGSRFPALIRPFVAKPDTAGTSREADGTVETSKQEETVDLLQPNQGPLTKFRKEGKDLPVKIPAASCSTPKMTPSSNPKPTILSAPKSSLAATVKTSLTPCQKPEKFVIKLMNPMAKSSMDAASGASTGSQAKKDLEAEVSQGHMGSGRCRGSRSTGVDTESGEYTNPESLIGVEADDQNRSAISPIGTRKGYVEGDLADDVSQNGRAEDSERLPRDEEENFSTRETMQLGDWSKKGRRSTLKAKRIERSPIEKEKYETVAGLATDKVRQECAKEPAVADQQSGLDGSQGPPTNKVRLPRWTYDSVKFELDLEGEGDRWQEMQEPYRSAHYSTMQMQPWVSRGDLYGDKDWVRKHSDSSSATETSSEDKGAPDEDLNNPLIEMRTGREKWLKPRRVTKLGSAQWSKAPSGVGMLHPVVKGFSQVFQGSYCVDPAPEFSDEKLSGKGATACLDLASERRAENSPRPSESTWEGGREAAGKEIMEGSLIKNGDAGHPRGRAKLPPQRESKVNAGVKDGGLAGIQVEEGEEGEILGNRVEAATAEENKRWFAFLGKTKGSVIEKDRSHQQLQTIENAADIDQREWRGASEEEEAGGGLAREGVLTYPEKRWFRNVGVQGESRNPKLAKQDGCTGLEDLQRGSSYDIDGKRRVQGHLSRRWTCESRQEELDVSTSGFCRTVKGRDRMTTSKMLEEWQEGVHKPYGGHTFREEILEDLGSNSKDAMAAQRWGYGKIELVAGKHSETGDGETQGSRGNKIILRVDTKDRSTVQREARQNRSHSWSAEEQSQERTGNEERLDADHQERRYCRLIRATDKEFIGDTHAAEGAGSGRKESREDFVRVDEEESVKTGKRRKERHSSSRREVETEYSSQVKEQGTKDGVLSGGGSVGGDGLPPPHMRRHSARDKEVRSARASIDRKRGGQQQVPASHLQKRLHVVDLAKLHEDESQLSISGSGNACLDSGWATQDGGAHTSRTDEKLLKEAAIDSRENSEGDELKATRGSELKVKLSVGSLRMHKETVMRGRDITRAVDEEDSGNPMRIDSAPHQSKSSSEMKLEVESSAKEYPAKERMSRGIGIKEPTQQRHEEVREHGVRRQDGKHLLQAAVDSRATQCEVEVTAAQQHKGRQVHQEPELESGAAPKGPLKVTLKIKNLGGGSSDRKLTLVTTPNGSLPLSKMERSDSGSVKKGRAKSEERYSGLTTGLEGMKVKTVGSLMADKKTMLGSGESGSLGWGEEGSLWGRSRGGSSSVELADRGSRHFKHDDDDDGLPDRSGQLSEGHQHVVQVKKHRHFRGREKRRGVKSVRRDDPRDQENQGGREEDWEKRGERGHRRKRRREGNILFSSDEGLKLVIKKPKHS